MRRNRDVTQADVARIAGLPASTVKRFEDGSLPREATFQAYLAALASGDVPQPLNAEQVLFLRKAYVAARSAAANEVDFLNVSFREVRRRTCAAPLKQLLLKLARHPHPAMVRDELLFIHAFNGHVLDMLRLTSDSPLLARWEAWHVLGTSLLADSPIARSHVGDTFAPMMVGRFFHASLPMLFTVQMRCLLGRLDALSAGVFEAWWRTGATLLLAEPSYDVPRPMLVDGEAHQTTVRAVESVRVELAPGYQATFTMVSWEPAEPEARGAPGYVPEAAGLVVYAADHDPDGTHHVNDWPEVRAALCRE